MHGRELNRQIPRQGLYHSPNLIETALEEMEHFREFYKAMQQKGVPLPAKMEPDHYSIN